jgi:hypothetical protein
VHRGQAIAAVVVNLALNGDLAWLIYRGLTEVPLVGDAYYDQMAFLMQIGVIPPSPQK